MTMSSPSALISNDRSGCSATSAANSSSVMGAAVNVAGSHASLMVKAICRYCIRLNRLLQWLNQSLFNKIKHCGGCARAIDGQSQNACRSELSASGPADQRHQFLSIHSSLIVELHIQNRMLPINRLNADLFGRCLQARVLQQRKDVRRDGTVAVRQLGFHFFAFLRIGRLRDSLMGPEALIFVRNVRGRDPQIEPEVQRRMDFGSDFFPAQFANCLFEHADVHVESDRVDMPMLFPTEQIPSSSEFEIERGNFESGAEIAEFFEGGEAFACNLGQFAIGLDQEIAIGPAV